MMPDRYVKSCLLCAQDALVGDAQALERQKGVGAREALRLLRRLLAVAVIRGVEVPDTVGLAERFH